MAAESEPVAAPEAEVVVEEVVVAEPEPEPEESLASEDASEDEDLEGARLIALNMALNGNSREDIDRYLQENFDLSNRKALLDEVYESVEG